MHIPALYPSYFDPSFVEGSSEVPIIELSPIWIMTGRQTDD